MEKNFIKKLFNVKNAFDISRSNNIFVKAIKQNVLYHYNHCPKYKEILDSFQFDPNCLNDIKDIEKIPPIPTLYFKKNYLCSVPKRKLLIKASSSGTSGNNQSKIGIDLYSLFNMWKMVKKIFAFRKIWTLKPTRFVIFGYEHKFKNAKAVAKTAWAFTFTAPALSKDYAIRYINHDYVVDLDNLEKKLIKYSKKKNPVRTLGFPSYTYFLLKQMKEKNIRVSLPKGSILCLAGGWKQFFAEKVSKEDLYKIVKEVLNINEENILEYFGAVEHPIMWSDCIHHHFHIPSYARVVIRDVDTLEPLPHGQAGLINLITPVLRSCPVSSIMTDDIGIIHDEPCKCGNKDPYLEILGRAGLEEIKTCAVSAEELLKGTQK